MLEADDGMLSEEISEFERLLSRVREEHVRVTSRMRAEHVRIIAEASHDTSCRVSPRKSNLSIVPCPSHEPCKLSYHSSFAESQPSAAKFATKRRNTSEMIVSQLRQVEATTERMSVHEIPEYFCGLDKRGLADKLEFCVALVIILNVCTMGVSADFGRNWAGWAAVEIVFLVVYLMEVAIKIILRGVRDYCVGVEKYWNWFDLVIICFAFVDVIATATAMASDESGALDITFFRIIRICRLTRLLRLLKAPFFKEILMMINGIAGSARTLFWSMALLCLPCYTIALLMREIVGASDDYRDERFYELFTTVGMSGFTVFRCVMGDCSDPDGRPIIVLLTQQLGWQYALGYGIFLSVSVFGLFNVIAGIFVENVIDVARLNDKLAQRRRLHDERRTAQLIKNFVESVLTVVGLRLVDSNSFSLEATSEIELSEEQFDLAMADPTVRDILDNLDVAAEDRHGLFDVLDADNSGSLQISEIIDGLMRMRGAARRGDVVICSIILRNMQRQVGKIIDQVAVLSSNQQFSSELSHRSICSQPASGWQQSSTWCAI
eukprot:TRINITY_DN15829_c0_g1_i2.p1 TRINITY_DN15829_c0_g1~~TRINITY_DN15829_c0_g1_i2.p1  ORF type:complete len:567 (-),score=62.23 TRINITY_DN15829_c0_g1_i2:301-1950(-)